MGDGKEGDTAGQSGRGPGQGGEQKGRHVMEVDVTIEELADVLGEELKLPRIEPKGFHNLTSQKDRYNGVRPIGLASLRHFKRTYREARKRQVTIGDYDTDDPVIIPIKRDLRYRSWTEIRKPQSSAAR